MRLRISSSDTVSIHASAREATYGMATDNTEIVVSIHASAREATLFCAQQTREDMFRSTPPRGRRQSGAAAAFAILRFRSTPPRGRRHPPVNSGGRRFVFRSTPPRGRRRSYPKPLFPRREQPQNCESRMLWEPAIMTSVILFVISNDFKELSLVRKSRCFLARFRFAPI